MKFCQWLIIDLIYSWVELKILIVAINLPIEKYDFDQSRCQFGNFPNVPTTGRYETENKCDICAFYQWIKGIEHILHNFMYTMYFYDYIHLLYIYFLLW